MTQQTFNPYGHIKMTIITLMIVILLIVTTWPSNSTANIHAPTAQVAAMADTVTNNHSWLVFDTMFKFDTVHTSRQPEKQHQALLPTETQINIEPVKQTDQEIKIVVNLPAYELSLIQANHIIKTFPIAIAAPKYAMTLGLHKASHLIWNPSWTPPPSDWAVNERPRGPGERGNPLGRIKIRLGGNFLIHGGGGNTVGRAVSHGCIRMRDEDVLELARAITELRQLPITDKQWESLVRNRNRQFGIKIEPIIPVEVIYQTIIVEKRQVQIHPDIYRQGTNSFDNLQTVLTGAGFNYQHLSMQEQLSLLRAVKYTGGKTHRIELYQLNDDLLVKK
ncbi:MAG: L,D-transpeptidase [Acidobacteriota bacterium]